MSCNEWKEYKLEELCEYRKDKVKIDDINLYNYISTENMMPNKGGIEIASSLPNSKTVARYLEGDILISNIRPYFKKIWYAKNDGGNSNDVLVFKNISKDKLNNTFLYYLLSSDNFFDYVMSTAKGTKMPRGDKDAIMRYNINLPSLEEQEKIANILSSLDDKIELNNEMNKTLEEMAQSIFKRWFVDFEFPNEDGEPYKSSGGEMVDSELGMIPKGWEVKELSQLVNIITKSEKPFENEDILYEHFSIPALDSNKLPILEFGNSISSNKYKIDNDCILISKLNPNNKRIWNPYCNTSNSICSTEFIVYQAINNYPKSYIYEIINSDEFTKFLVANATGSTGSRQRVKPKDTLGYKIVLPTIDKIIEIDKILSPIHKNIQLNTQESNTILQIRNTLLPKLMSGEIKVN